MNARRLLCGVLVVVMAVGLAACGGDDDGGSATATTASPTFCQGLADFKAKSNSRDGLGTPEADAKRGEEVAAAARVVAGAAPESVKSAAVELETGAEDVALASAVNSTSPPAVLDKGSKQIEQALKKLDPYAQKNCPGGAGPTTAGG